MTMTEGGLTVPGTVKVSLPAGSTPSSLSFGNPPPPIRVNPSPAGAVAQVLPQKLILAGVGGSPEKMKLPPPSPVSQAKSPSAKVTVLVVVALGFW